MRESQKMCLDYKLHKKIIASIVMIQRWFKSKLQQEKFKCCRSAAIKIQSFWRMYVARNKFHKTKIQVNAAVLIQSTFRMFRQRKIYKKLLNGLVILQAHIRGKAARSRFKKLHQKRVLKERYKLRNTQSLPINERSIDGTSESIDVEISRSYPKLVHSLDYSIDNVSNSHMRKTSTTSKHEQSLLHCAEHQFRDLMVSSKRTNTGIESTTSTSEDVDSRSPRSYNIDAASKQYYDDSLIKKR